MKEITKSRIGKARNYIEVFILGGIVTFVAASIYGKSLNDKENAEKLLVRDDQIIEDLDRYIDSEEEA